MYTSAHFCGRCHDAAAFVLHLLHCNRRFHEFCRMRGRQGDPEARRLHVCHCREGAQLRRSAEYAACAGSTSSLTAVAPSSSCSAQIISTIRGLPSSTSRLRSERSGRSSFSLRSALSATVVPCWGAPMSLRVHSSDQVPLTHYGLPTNVELAERFGVAANDAPVRASHVRGSPTDV